MRLRQPSRVLSSAPRRPSTVLPAPSILLRPSSSSSSSAPSSSSSSTSSASSSSSVSWQPVLPSGTSPAYDAALSYISSDTRSLLSRAAKLRSRASDHPTHPELVSRIASLEASAYVNDPSTRHRFGQTRGRGEMDKPVMRHLAKQAWLKEGGLDVTLGRVFQNKLVPDLLPDIPTTEPLALTPQPLELPIEPATYLPPSSFSQPPTLTFQPFDHPSTPSAEDPNPTALYTLLVLDPDSPDVAKQGFTERVHYLKTGIPLGVTTGEVDLFSSAAGGQELLSWEPPAPERGSPLHRYTFLLLRQNSSSTTTPFTSAREDFSLRQYLAANDMTPECIAGVSLFRAVWSAEESEYIDGVWREYRGREAGAPVYGKPPKEVRYGMPQSAVAKRVEAVQRDAWEKAVREMFEQEREGVPLQG